MKAFLVLLATIVLVGSYSAFGPDANAKPIDEEFLRGYMAGEYDLPSWFLFRHTMIASEAPTYEKIIGYGTA